MNGHVDPAGLRAIRLAELDGWCGMLHRRHPDMRDLLARIAGEGRRALDGLGVEEMLSLDIIGASIDRYEHSVAVKAAR